MTDFRTPTTQPAGPTDPSGVRRERPGLIEVVLALAVFALVGYGTPQLLKVMDIDPVVDGILLGMLSGVAGIAGFFVAWAVRVRRFAPFGVKGIGVKWVLLGIAGGVLAWLVSRIIIAVSTLVSGAGENVQEGYNEAARGGSLALVISTIGLAVLTPIGEELVFRGVVTSALLRWGAPVGVIGSAVIFALAHGWTLAALTALMVGLVNGELRRRSGSVWPGVIAHVVNNLAANLIVALVL